MTHADAESAAETAARPAPGEPSSSASTNNGAALGCAQTTDPPRTPYPLATSGKRHLGAALESTQAGGPAPIVLGKHGRPLVGAALAQALGHGPQRGRKFPQPWTGGWGAPHIKRSKLGRLTRTIRAELRDEFERPDGRPLSGFQERLLDIAAEAGALWRQAEIIWSLPQKQQGAERITRRGLLTVMRAFTGHVQNLERLGGLRRKDAGLDLATSLRQASQHFKEGTR
jgi:hypothetical protein